MRERESERERSKHQCHHQYNHQSVAFYRLMRLRLRSRSHCKPLPPKSNHYRPLPPKSNHYSHSPPKSNHYSHYSPPKSKHYNMVMTCNCPGCENCLRVPGWGPKCQQNRAKGEEALFLAEQPHLIRCAFLRTRAGPYLTADGGRSIT